MDEANQANAPSEAAPASIGVPREIKPGERRVALSPNVVRKLVERGHEVRVEEGAGAAAQFPDTDYREAGARIIADATAVWECDLVVKIQPPQEDDARKDHEVDRLREGAVLLSFLWPDDGIELLERMAGRGVSGLALERIPRTTRAQSMDVLSSMAAIAGYRAVLEAANHYGRYLGKQITAAGSTEPARVLVIGAGVAGLAATSTAREMGARVKAFDTRAAVREEVESLGATFLELDFDESGEGEGGYAKVMSEAFLKAERELFLKEARETDIIITTAGVPGKQPPMLITTEAVEAIPHGGVVVDLVAERGGNCQLTVPGEVVRHGNVTVIGYGDFASRMPNHASDFMGRNLFRLIELLCSHGVADVTQDDDILQAMLVVDRGTLRWPPPPPPPLPAPSAPAPGSVATPALGPSLKPRPKSRPEKGYGMWVATAVAVALFLLVGLYAPPEFIHHFAIFVLSIFIGWQVIWSVTPALHTPLISVTNAISAIIIVAGLVLATAEASNTVLWLSAGAIFVASINIFGGFLVTQRMLRMFRRDVPSTEVSDA